MQLLGVLLPCPTLQPTAYPGNTLGEQLGKGSSCSQLIRKDGCGGPGRNCTFRPGFTCGWNKEPRVTDSGHSHQGLLGEPEGTSSTQPWERCGLSLRGFHGTPCLTCD